MAPEPKVEFTVTPFDLITIDATTITAATIDATAITAHSEAMAQLCRRLGAGYRRFSTDQPLEIALFDFLRERMQRGRWIQRAASGAPRT